MEEEIVLMEENDIEEIDIEEENYSGKPYILPIASKDILGGIKVGKNLTIDENGILNAQAGGGSLDVDLTDYAKKNELPTKISQLENDSNFINQIKTINGQSLEGTGDIVIESGSGIIEGDSVPINAIFEYEGNSVPEGYIEVEDVKTNERNIMTTTIEQYHTIANTNQYERLILISQEKIGNKLSTSNGHIIIGKGVNYIMIGWYIQFQRISATGLKYSKLQINNQDVDKLLCAKTMTQGQRDDIVRLPSLLKVKEGDIISLLIYATQNDQITPDRTGITVEVVG